METIAAKDVQPGDRIYNKYAYHPAAAWVEVRRIETMDDGTVGLVTGTYTEWRHPAEAIAVVPLPSTAGEVRRVRAILNAAEVRQDDEGKPIVRITTCGACGRSWNDAAVSSITPVPSGRCPFEYAH